MTNYAVTPCPAETIPGATVAACGAGLSPRDATERAGAIMFALLSMSWHRSQLTANAARRADCKRILRNNEVSRFAPFKA
jgi:hypothetical protein